MYADDIKRIKEIIQEVQEICCSYDWSQEISAGDISDSAGDLLDVVGAADVIGEP